MLFGICKKDRRLNSNYLERGLIRLDFGILDDIHLCELSNRIASKIDVGDIIYVATSLDDSDLRVYSVGIVTKTNAYSRITKTAFSIHVQWTWRKETGMSIPDESGLYHSRQMPIYIDHSSTVSSEIVKLTLRNTPSYKRLRKKHNKLKRKVRSSVNDIKSNLITFNARMTRWYNEDRDDTSYKDMVDTVDKLHNQSSNILEALD